jgi:lysozyme
MRRTIFAAICAALLAGGCGSPSLRPQSPATTPGFPPESARHPEGYKPVPPPVSLPPVKVSAKHIDTVGLHLLESFEGYSRCAYWDGYGKVWTVGFGQTKGAYAGFCFSGRSAAEANLKASVESEYEWAIRGLGVSLNEHQWDALCSFAYNLGAGIFTGTLRYDLQHRQFYAASRIMLQYVHAGGVVLQGLRTRREAEMRLFLTPVRKPTPKPSRAALLRRRAVLRALLTRYHCRTGHAKPARYWTACGVWRREGAAVNRAIRALK